MPRWPAGLHRAAGSIRAAGSPTFRQTPDDPKLYWRQTVSELHAGAQGVVVPGFFSIQALIPARASAGPQGVGERWMVDVVQVQFPAQAGQPPLVVQQIAAQIGGTTTKPPPPIVAQVWLSAGGTDLHLLAQTTQGGNDDLSVACPPLSAGEAITVIWYGWFPATGLPWFRLRGTKITLGT